jgi:integrase
MNFFGSSSLKPSSIKLFNSKIDEWIGYMPEHYKSIITIITLPSFAMKILESRLVVNTNTNKHIYIMSILSFFRHCKDILAHLPPETIDTLRQEWVKIYDANEAPIIQRRLENKPTDNQLKKEGVRLDFSKIVSIRDSLPIGSYERLLIAMYTMLPPVRADYFATHIVKGDQVPTEPNFIRIIAPDRIESVLTDFKTAKRYKQIYNLFPPELIKELLASLEKYPREYLFLNGNGKPHSRNSFTIWARRVLTRCFGKDFTLVFFRHIFATHFVMTNDMSKITDAQIKEISGKMGHSSEMFHAYRWVENGRKGELVMEVEEE